MLLDRNDVFEVIEVSLLGAIRRLVSATCESLLIDFTIRYGQAHGYDEGVVDERAQVRKPRDQVNAVDNDTRVLFDAATNNRTHTDTHNARLIAEAADDGVFR